MAFDHVKANVLMQIGGGIAVGDYSNDDLLYGHLCDQL